MSRHVFLIGNGGCGTTSLAHLFSRHPEIAVSDPKEPHFFSRDNAYGRGLDWYMGVFGTPTPETKVRVDASVSYSLLEYEESACERIAQHVQDPLFIYIGRNPFDRIESVFRKRHHFSHIVGSDIPFSLEKALAYPAKALLNGLYWQRSAPFRNRFGPASFLYLTSEDLRARPHDVLRTCFDFMGVAAERFPWDEPTPNLNAGSEKLCETPLLRWLRSRPVLWRAIGMWPASVRYRLIIKPLRRSASYLDMRWTSDMRALVTQVFRDDVRRFLAAAGKPADFWGPEFS